MYLTDVHLMYDWMVDGRVAVSQRGGGEGNRIADSLARSAAASGSSNNRGRVVGLRPRCRRLLGCLLARLLLRR